MQINAYIRDHLEREGSGLGWQRFNQQNKGELRVFGWPLEVLAIGGIFILTQFMAIGLGGLRFGGSLPEWLLLILAIAAVAAMVVLLGYMRRKAGV